MTNDKVFQMNFGKIYGLLLDKATRKGRTKDEVDEVICWLTGYATEQLEAFRSTDLCYGDFFRNAPQPNPNRALIKGVVCGVRVEEVEEPLMREIRYLDKLIDELAKGKPMKKILREDNIKTTLTKDDLIVAEKDYISRWKANAQQHFNDGDYEWICDLMDRQLPGRPYHRILEIGCGAGYSTLVFALRDYNVLAIDTNSEAIKYTKNLLEEHECTTEELNLDSCRSNNSDVCLWKVDLIHATGEIRQYIGSQVETPIELIVLCNPGGHFTTEITMKEYKFLLWGGFTEDEINYDYQCGKVGLLHKWAMLFAACGLSQLTGKPLLIIERGDRNEVEETLQVIQEGTGSRKIFEEYRPIKNAPLNGIKLSGADAGNNEEYWGVALYYPT